MSASYNPIEFGESVTVPLTERLSVRLYRGCRPRFLETAPLQKGLVLLLDGRELVEEGVGFGVPIVKYSDKTFFPGHAEVAAYFSGSVAVLKKSFFLDTVSRKKIGKAPIDDGFYSPVRKLFQQLYLNNPKLTPLFNKIMEIRELGIKTEFQTVATRGEIDVTYRCSSSAVEVEADLSRVQAEGCREILFLNEQGSGIFQKYADCRGSMCVGNRIGAWSPVTAEKASLQSSKGELEFCLGNIVGCKLYRGWECTRKRFSWAGLSYSLPPRCRRVQYTISVHLND
ncbi:MAG: hypothetical protein NWE93_12375 [Candidatus Bathyarchaeota archaeon]|nr:hypothetical protein [Candidatus Bathyarchaeota archaeon]